MMFKAIIFSSFLIAHAFASTPSSSKPAIAVLDIHPNFEYGQAGKEFRVHYSGLGDDYASESSAILNIYKKGQVAVEHKFTITDAKVKKAYYFVLPSAEDTAEYEVEVCTTSGTCSEKNVALSTQIQLKNNKEKKISCVVGHYDKDNEWVQDTSEPTFEIQMIGATGNDWVEESHIIQIEKDLKLAKYKSDWKRYSVGSNPFYNRQEQLFYTAVFYDVLHFKQLFDKRSGKDESRTRYSHDFCERKYLLSANAHLVNEATKEVKYRFKTTLFLSESGKKYFLSQDAIDKKRKVHVEMTHMKANIDAGTYKLYISFCATEKDAIESTICSDPISKDFQVQN